ncbi:unnamed protein product [Trichobilharzia regenti]|uniref:G_PROTEIN_RECEP_F1_2 domain-containing protein n=1 Tax=Trichobilharzia regenti TaxID=157069 RepID=A0A183WMW7_TRIRE|nr:unnamed protein product [Trichobilharzia regenti]VDQ09350.1 unnamed protein product [Trichobilharzia regenti]
MNSQEINFAETPKNILFQCQLLKQNYSYIQNLRCLSSSVIGVIVGYLLPVCSIPCILTNLFIAITVMFKWRTAARQLIYISGICLSSATADVFFIWLWQYPAYGLPYTTNGAKFFTFLNVSPTACRFHRFVYSSSATLMCNMRICSSLDRCLAIYVPIKLKKFHHKYAWFVYGATACFSALLMLPLATEMDWIPSKYGVQCWFRNANTHPNANNSTNIYLQLHHAFLSNLGPVQTILLIIIDLAFVVKFRRHLNKHKRHNTTTTDTKKETKTFNRYRLLFISAVSYTLLATVQCIFLALARLSSVEIISFETTLAYNMSDILWYLNILREVLDFVIYQKCFRIFNIIVVKVSVICCRPTLSTRSGNLFTRTEMTTE